MPPTDLTPEQRAAVEFAVARTWRFDLDRADRAQDAAEAVLRANDCATRQASERASYLSMRAIGGIRDAVRRELRANLIQSRKRNGAPRAGLTRGAEAALDALVSPDDTEAAAIVAQAVRAVEQIGGRHAIVFARLAVGAELREIGRELGVSESRVCQLRSELRRVLDRYLLPA